MRCLKHEDIVDYVLGVGEEKAMERSASHLATGCPRCRREAEAVKALASHLANEDVWEEVPRHVLERAFAIFPAPATAGDGACSRVGTARPREDGTGSASDTPGSRKRATARSSRARPRPFAPGFLVPQPATRSADSTPLPAGGTLKVSVKGQDIRGQVFDASREDLSGIAVRLLDAGGGEAGATATDPLGRFSFKGLTAGSYTVVVENHKGDARCKVDIAE
ncbi:MAG: carboxypeptidase-like regulatory domain-containing protein [Bacillota bacterium]